MAKRIVKQIQAASKKINRAITSYNDIPNEDNKLTRDVVMDLNGDIWQVLTPEVLNNTNASVPVSVKRKLIDTLHLQKRATEELNIVTTDLKRYISNLSHVCQVILGKIDNMKQCEPSPYHIGAIALLTVHLMEYKNRLSTANSVWTKISDEESEDVVLLIEDILTDTNNESPLLAEEDSYSDNEQNSDSDDDNDE